MTRITSTLLILIAISLLWVLPAAGHAPDLVRSEPAPDKVLTASPSEVVLWFNEELKSGESIVQVFDAQGTQVDLGNGGVDLNDAYHASMRASLPPDLANGTYRVYYRLVLLDNDASHSQFTFVIGEPSASVVIPELAPLTPEAASQSLRYGWILGVIGAIIVASAALMILRRALSRRGSAG